jgi:hypothetical protein
MKLDTLILCSHRPCHLPSFLTEEVRVLDAVQDALRGIHEVQNVSNLTRGEEQIERRTDNVNSLSG